MNITTVDVNGVALPEGFTTLLHSRGVVPILRIMIDFKGDGTLERIDNDLIQGFDFPGSLSGTNGYACSDSVTITLDNQDHFFSPTKFNTSYDASQGWYNGPKQADGRGNLRKGRNVVVDIGLEAFPDVWVRLFDGHIDNKGFREKVSAANINSVVIVANDRAKQLLDKKEITQEVAVGSKTVDSEVALIGCKISDPADPTHSIVHILAHTYGGIPLDHIDAPTISVVVDYVKLERDPWTELALLAEAVQGSLAFNGSRLFFGDSALFPAGAVSTAYEFTNDHYSGLDGGDDFDKIVNKFVLSYSTFKKLDKQAIWLWDNSDQVSGLIKGGGVTVTPSNNADIMDPDTVYKCKYTIYQNTPTTKATLVTGESNPEDVDSTEVVAATNVELKTDATAKVALFDKDTYPNAAIVRLKQETFWLSYFKILGEPIIQDKENTVSFKDSDSITKHGLRKETYSNKYIPDKTITDPSDSTVKSFANAWGGNVLARKKRAWRTLSFNVDFGLVLLRPGMTVTVVEDRQGTEISFMGRIESARHSYNSSTNSWSSSFTVAETSDSWAAQAPIARVVRAIARSVVGTRNYVYRGSVAAPPTDAGENDYCFVNLPAGEGGGKILRYQNDSWAEADSSWNGYADALATTLIDTAKWAQSTGGTTDKLTQAVSSLVANFIGANRIQADNIDVDTLSALTADLGTVTAGVMRSTDWGAAAGMEIDLTNRTIKIGGSSNPKFSVSADGTLNATGATITGTLTATAGSIGGFSIGAADITSANILLASGASARFQVGAASNAAGLASGSAAGDVLLWAGSTYANRASAPFRVTGAGSLVASAGSVGGISVVSDAIQSSNYAAGSAGFKLASSGAAELNSVTVRGIIYASGGTFAGSLSAATGTLGALTVNGTITVGVGGSIVGTGYSLGQSSSTIGGFTLSASSIVAGNFSLVSGALAYALVGTGAMAGGIAAGSASGDVLLWAGAAYADRATAAFRVTAAGGLVATNATISGAITATSGSFTGAVTIGATGSLIAGDVNLSSSGLSGTGYSLNANGLTLTKGSINIGSGVFQVSTAGALTASSATISGTVTTSALTATGGTVGGWTLAATTLTGGSLVLTNTGNIAAGTSNDILRISADNADYRLWIGNATAASAPFRISKAGVLTASGAIISGAITATSGSFTGAVTIGATGSLVAGDTTLNSTGISGTGYSLNANGLTLTKGSINIGSGVFTVTSAGALTATNATITGAITATSGSFSGTITAASGSNIAGWITTSSVFKSAASGARIELNAALHRITTIDSNNLVITAQGNLYGLAINGAPWSSTRAYVIGEHVNLNGIVYKAIAASTNQTPPNATYWQVSTDTWGSSDYGFWAKPGNSILFDGGFGLSSGDIVATDSNLSLKQKNSGLTNDEIIRLGSDTGYTGLHLYSMIAGKGLRIYNESLGSLTIRNTADEWIRVGPDYLQSSKASVTLANNICINGSLSVFDNSTTRTIISANGKITVANPDGTEGVNDTNIIYSKSTNGYIKERTVTATGIFSYNFNQNLFTSSSVQFNSVDTYNLLVRSGVGSAVTIQPTDTTSVTIKLPNVNGTLYTDQGGLINGTVRINPTTGNYNEGIRIAPSTSGGHSILALGADGSATSGNGTGQWTLIRYPVANNYNFSIRGADAIDRLTITQAGAVSITGSLSISGVTASKVAYFDANKVLVSSSITPTELGYLSGVTSALQAQINSKVNLSGGDFTGNISINNSSPTIYFTETDQTDPVGRWQIVGNGGSLFFSRATSANWASSEYPLVLNSDGFVSFNKLSANTIPYLDGNKVLNSSSVTPTELGYLSGVTSALQAQINGKAASGHNHDGTYSLTSHNHDSAYSLTSHNHSGVYQPLDTDLTAIAGLSGNSGILKKTAADTWTLDTNSYSLTSHNHDGTYSLTSHNHDSAYSALGHTHSGVTIGSTSISLGGTQTVIQGLDRVVTTAVGNNQAGYNAPIVGGGSYANTTGAVTGYIKITLPQSWTNTMLNFTINVYNYVTDTSFTIRVAGYNYSASSAWLNVSAQLISSSNTTFSNLAVRFGHDGTKCAIYIGEAGSVWTYPQITIRDFHAGYSYADELYWSTGWGIGITTTLGTITNSAVAYGYATKNGTEKLQNKMFEYTNTTFDGCTFYYNSGTAVGTVATDILNAMSHLGAGSYVVVTGGIFVNGAAGATALSIIEKTNSTTIRMYGTPTPYSNNIYYIMTTSDTAQIKGYITILGTII